MFAKNKRRRVFEIQLLTKGTSEIRGYKFVEGLSEKDIKEHKNRYVGTGVSIGSIASLPYKSLEEAVDDYNKKNGIVVVGGVRYYKNHAGCEICESHFSK